MSKLDTRLQSNFWSFVCFELLVERISFVYCSESEVTDSIVLQTLSLFS